MNLFAISAIINIVTSIVLGLLVLLRDYRKATHITFFLFTVAVGFWSFSYFLWQIAGTSEDALFWVEMFMFGAIFIPFFYLHFTTAFINKNLGFSKTVVFGYLVAGCFAVLNWTPLFIQGVSEKLIFAFWPTPGPLYLPFLIIWILYAVLAVVFIAKRLPEATGTERAQLQYMLAGTAIGYAGGVTNYFLWFDIAILPYGNISASIYIALVAYAMLKHRLFNLKVIATEFLTFSLWLFIFIRMLLEDTLRDQVINGALLFVTIVIGTILIRSVDSEVEAREEIQKLAENLEDANARLRELDRQKSEFLSMAAHQLRTPLTSIKGYASLMLEGSYGDLPEKVNTVLETIFSSSSRMVDTVSDFLNVSRIEQGKMEYRMEHTDLGGMAKSVVLELALSAKEKGLNLEYHDDGNGPYPIYADTSKLEHVISNIVDNAIKYTQKGSVVVQVEKNIAQNVGRVRITDTGVGIPADALPKLFDKFVRARNANEINVTGTGLGLYVAKEMIEKHKGKIWAESKGENKGSMFIVEIPLSDEKNNTPR